MTSVLKYAPRTINEPALQMAALNAQDEIAIAAHDLRNPLACIMLNLELLETRIQMGKPMNMEAVISRGIRAAERMDGMIKRLLEDARQGRDIGTLPVRKSCCDLTVILQAAVEHNQLSAQEKSISIKSAGASCTIDTDEELLVEAADNLISNAIKYSEPGTEIRCTTGQDRGSVFIRVMDEGKGLTLQDISRIGRPYQTLSARPTAGEYSTGIGLWSTRRILAALGGELNVTSGGPDKGATFTLRLPRLH